MIDVEPLVVRELGRLVPEPAAGRADWNDVVDRAGLRHARRRRLVLVLAVAAAVLLTAAAVAKSLGGFGAWVSGTPGRPASEEAQSRFAGANGRSWASFPTDTELRELIRTDVAGREYVLFGFRSGDSLCLQLAAGGFARQLRQCAPASAIANLSVPIVVLNGQWTFLNRAQRPVATVSFGIIADGVTRVGVQTVLGYRNALVGGNAYLFVADRPNTGDRIFAVSAFDTTGRRTAVAIESFPNGDPSRRPGGPTEVDAKITQPRVGWAERGEKRGFPAAGGIRFVKPDPLSNLEVGLSGTSCLAALDDAGRMRAQSCGNLFARDPINALISCNFCGGFMEVRGVASDGIDRVAIFLADGTNLTAAFRHNLFTARVAATSFPIRIVGYDAHERVVSTRLWGFGPIRRVPQAPKRLRDVFQLRGPNGTVARLRVARTARGFDCWSARFSTGQRRGGCVPPYGRGPQSSVDLVQPAGRDVFFVGQVGRRTRQIEVRFGDGDAVRARLGGGHYVLAVPREHLSSRQQRAFLVALDQKGMVTLRQRVFFRLP